MQNLHITTSVGEAEEEDSAPRPLMDRIAGFRFSDEDRCILAHGVGDGAIMVTGTAVPERMEALDDAGAVEIDENDTSAYGDSLQDVTGAVISAPRPAVRRPDDPQPGAANPVPAATTATGKVESGTSGMAGMDIPQAGVTASRAILSRNGPSRRVRSHWLDGIGEPESLAVERDNLPGQATSAAALAGNAAKASAGAMPSKSPR